MIEKLKAAIEAERDKLLAELPQAAEPRLSAIRREIEACGIAARPIQPIARRLIHWRRNRRPAVASAVLGASKRNCDVERDAIPRHLEPRTMVSRGGIHRGI